MYLKMRPRWPLRWLPHWYVLASWSFFSRFASGRTFSNEFELFGNLEEILVNFWNKFRWILNHFLYLWSCMSLKVSRYPYDCCNICYLNLSGPHMDPSWLRVGSRKAYDGLKLFPSISSWNHVGSRSGFPVAPEPTEALSNLFHVAFETLKPLFMLHKIQHRPQKGHPNPQLGHSIQPTCTPKNSTWFQRIRSQVLNATAQIQQNEA